MKTKFQLLYKKNVILDSNTINDLDALNRLGLTVQLFNEVYYSKNAFLQEMDGLVQHKLVKAGYKPLCLERNDGYLRYQYLKEYHKALSKCEKVIIAIAAERGILCCTNDKPARMACEDIGVELVNTAGILCGCYENGIIGFNELIKLFNKYIYYCRPRLSVELIGDIRQLYNIPDIGEKVVYL